jgi:hypothetical protein
MNVTTVPLVRHAEDLTPEWLTKTLGAPVASSVVTHIGAGQMGRTYLVEHDAPSLGRGRVVVKLASDDPSSRATGVATQAYLREVEFYRAFGERARGAVPTCYGAVIDEDGEWFTLVLSEAIGTVGDQLVGMGADQARWALEALATVQTPTLGDHMTGLTPWLNLPWPLDQSLYQSVLPGFVDRFGQALSQEQLELCTWFGDHVDAWVAERRAPLGLVHGDFRVDNLLFEEPRCTVVDWQTVTWGPIMRDVSYLLGSSLEPDARRASERELVASYAATLARGAQVDVRQSEAWDGYRHQSLYGVLMTVVASMIVESTGRGDAMFAALIHRHTTHALDLGARDLVEASQIAPVPLPVDEQRHQDGSDLLWSESHYLDAVSSDGTTGLFLRFGRLPAQNRTHVMGAIVRRGHPTLMIADPDAPSPSGDVLRQEVDAGEFTASIEIVEPLRAARVSLAGIVGAFDDPAGVLRQESGISTPVQLDLTWTTDATPFAWRLASRYEIPCEVRGSLSIGGETLELDVRGQRDHSWGNRDWWHVDWCWTAFHLDDGTRGHTVSTPAAPHHAVGYLQRDGVVDELGGVTSEADFTDSGLFGPTVVTVSPQDLKLTMTPTAFAPVRMQSYEGSISFFTRAMVTVEVSDGRRGSGWIEWNLVQTD